MLNENEEKIVIEALRHTEMRLESLNNLATSAETRTAQFATLVTAIGAVLAVNAKNFPSPALAYIAALMCFGVSIFAVASNLPKRFHVTGHFWREWEGHIADGDTFQSVLISQAKENDQRIDFNNCVLEKSADNFRLSFNFLFWALCFFISSQLGAVFWAQY